MAVVFSSSLSSPPQVSWTSCGSARPSDLTRLLLHLQKSQNSRDSRGKWSPCERDTMFHTPTLMGRPSAGVQRASPQHHTSPDPQQVWSYWFSNGFGVWLQGAFPLPPNPIPTLPVGCCSRATPAESSTESCLLHRSCGKFLLWLECLSIYPWTPQTFLAC